MPQLQLPSQRRPSIEDLIAQLTGPDRQVDPVPSPNAQALPPAMPAIGDQPLPRSAASSLPEAPPPPMAMPSLPKLPSRSDRLQSQLDASDQPLSRKQLLLGSLARVAPIAIGGLLGGTNAAAGAAAGGDEYAAEQQQAKATRRKSLVDQIDKQQGLDQRGVEHQATVDAQIQGIQQRADSAAAAATSREQLAQIKAESDKQIQEVKTQLAQQGQDADLRKHGFKRDTDGHIVGVEDAELSPIQRQDQDDKKALVTLRESQTELAAANAEVAKAKNDPNSPAFRQAQQRLQNAQASHSIAERRLNLSENQFEMRSRGTMNGEALPGAMIADDGQTVGTGFQGNVRPTGAQRVKADLANSASEQLGDLKSIVERRPDIFGPAAGRVTDFNQWVGSQDPDAQRFQAARTIAGDHLAGVFGGRSEAALEALDKAIGHFKDNPKAVIAGIDQLDHANQAFQKAGKVKTVGSAAAKPALPGQNAAAPVVQKSKTTGLYRYSTDGGKTWASGQPPK